MSKPSPARARGALLGAGLTVAGALGFAVASAPLAGADIGPPLPTVPGPSVPVAVPTVPVPTVTLPDLGGTTGTTPGGSDGTPTTTPADPGRQGAGGTTTTSSTGSSSGDGAQADRRTPAGVDGGVMLNSGFVSVPVGSVRPPARLVIDAVGVAPTVVRSPRQQLQLVLRVMDTRGYLVRNAVVVVGSVPTGTIGLVAARTTRTDGTASFRLRLARPLPRKPGRLTLAVRVRDARGRVAALRRVSVALRLPAAY
jgi:hypothetical protein